MSIDSIYKLTKTNDVDALLRLLKIQTPEHNTKNIGVDIITPWTRGGAETYKFVFKISVQSISKTFIFKACVPSSPTIAIDDIIKKWVERRKVLEQYGICTPYLYGIFDGCLLEDYIPYELSGLQRNEWTKELNSQLQYYCNVLTKLQFFAINPFSDLRTDLKDIYVIDFGSDLGPPNASNNLPDYSSLASTWIKENLK